MRNGLFGSPPYGEFCVGESPQFREREENVLLQLEHSTGFEKKRATEIFVGGIEADREDVLE